MANTKDEKVKKLEARVKQDYFLGSVRAFSGFEFVKTEWRPVPDGFEKQAQSHDLLEVRPVQEEKQILETPKVKEVKTPAPMAEVTEESAEVLEVEETPEKRTRRPRKKDE